MPAAVVPAEAIEPMARAIAKITVAPIVARDLTEEAT